MGKRCDGTATVGFSVNPSESEDGIRATFEGLQACFFGLYHNYKCVRILNVSRNIVDILDGEEIIRYKNLSKWEETKLPDA